MTDATYSLPEVNARWTYSEISDGTLGHIYDSFAGSVELRAKRKAGRAFTELSEADRYALAFLCGAARPNLMIFKREFCHQLFCNRAGYIGFARVKKAADCKT